MSTLASYSDLVAFVTDHLELDADTIAQLPNLIRLAELKLDRDIVTGLAEQVTTANTANAVPTVTLPSDFRRMIRVTNSSGVELTPVPYKVLIDSYTGGGAPTGYAIHNGAFYVGPTPDAAYTLTLVYSARITPLTATNTSNWLLAQYPDAYVYSTLAEAEAFRGNIEAAARWLGLLDGLIPVINERGAATANNAATDTYDGILQFVSDQLELTADARSRLPAMLGMVGRKLNRALLPPEREATATSPTVAAQQTITLPNDFRQIRHIMLDDDYPLEQVTLNVLQGGYANDSASGKPKVYAIADGALYFGPIPDAVYTITLVYLADIIDLSHANQTNWITDNNPDVYVFGLCAEAEAFRGNIPAADRWELKFYAAIDDINKQGTRYRLSMPLRVRSPVVV